MANGRGWKDARVNSRAAGSSSPPTGLPAHPRFSYSHAGRHRSRGTASRLVLAVKGRKVSAHGNRVAWSQQSTGDVMSGRFFEANVLSSEFHLFF